jgi:hypothetical protein
MNDKLIANIVLNGGKLKPLTIKSGMRQDWLLYPLFSNIVMEFLARVIGQEEIKWTQIAKRKSSQTILIHRWYDFIP